MPDFAKVGRPFLERHCIKCHSGQEPKGEVSLDGFRDSSSLVRDRKTWDKVLKMVRSGEMPPEDRPQPTAAEAEAFVAHVVAVFDYADRHAKPNPGRVTMRRLNRAEYRNTVRDLLDLNMAMFDPTAGFPRDRTTEHLDNVGDALVTSGYLLQRYLDAADRVIEKALSPAKRPPVQTWRFTDGFRQQPEIDQVHRRTNFFEHITLYDVVGADKHEGAYAPIMPFREGVPHDGVYEIRFQAEAMNRLHPYDPEFLGTDPTEPLRLGIVAGNYLAGPLHKPQPIEPLLAEMDLAD